jgi:hypothetical protein
MRTDIEFTSDGAVCRGVLVTPGSSEGPFPTIVMAGGWCYVKEIVMPHYAERFVGAGFAVLMFDYRHLGASDGTPRQHIDPARQIEDYRNAISFAEGLPDVDAERIGVWGISYSGGHVLILGATDPRVSFVVSNIPVVDGFENMRRSHGELRFRALQDFLLADRRARFADPSRAGTLPMSAPDPARELSTWPYPEIGEVFSSLKATEAPLHEHYSTAESTELLLGYSVFPYLSRIVDKPVLMLVAEGDNITLWDLEIEAFNQVRSRRKELFVIPEASHMSLYSSRTRLDIASEATVEWLDRAVLGK